MTLEAGASFWIFELSEEAPTSFFEIGALGAEGFLPEDDFEVELLAELLVLELPLEADGAADSSLLAESV